MAAGPNCSWHIAANIALRHPSSSDEEWAIIGSLHATATVLHSPTALPRKARSRCCLSVESGTLSSWPSLVQSNNNNNKIIIIKRKNYQEPTLRPKVLNKHNITRNIHRDGNCYQQFYKKLSHNEDIKKGSSITM